MCARCCCGTSEPQKVSSTSPTKSPKAQSNALAAGADAHVEMPPKEGCKNAGVDISGKSKEVSEEVAPETIEAAVEGEDKVKSDGNEQSPAPGPKE
mmetsp:Transcript_50381/g.78831  ORF Transcript_50381/g.78831 Transcript_50381/m.78831 type:complete len:96 (+) Transcript_50381:2-289(+)